MPNQIEIEIPAVVTVKNLAELIDQPVTAVIGKLMGFGVLATINEDVDFDTAAIIADEFGFVANRQVSKAAQESTDVVLDEKNLDKRPPVVTIMGHVDHGKTTLLDTIRRTNVAAKEAGGITQHISSYQIEIPDKESGQPRLVTFLDTPGHSAFEAMRRHGAQITDLVVLIVAADDGVKPQTVEAIKHARNMNSPIVVAINKIDKPGADPEKVKRELSEYNLMPEEWGGNTVMVPISAKHGQGIPELLEIILLATDLQNLKANFNAPAVGVVIESHLEVGIGPVATVLIQNGTLKIGDFITIGGASGRVRALTNFKGKRIDSAGPSTPVEISGLDSVPNFGDRLVAVDSDKEARESARQHLRSQTAKRATTSLMNGTSTAQKEGNKSILNLVVKADTNGSLEAIKAGLQHMKNDDVEVRVISDGVGDISDNDISMATTANAAVIGFTVRVPAAVKTYADREKVGIYLFTIVYELFESVREVLAGLMPMVMIEQEQAQFRVLARFRDNRKNVVLGGVVEEGTVMPSHLVKVLRKKEVIAEGRIVSLRHGKDEAKQITSGSECGLELDLSFGAELVQKDDKIVFFIRTEERKALNL